MMTLRVVQESVNTRIFGCPGFSGFTAFRLYCLPAFCLSWPGLTELTSFPDIRPKLGSASW
jgi:hypothetical protein